MDERGWCLEWWVVSADDDDAAGGALWRRMSLTG